MKKKILIIAVAATTMLYGGLTRNQEAVTDTTTGLMWQDNSDVLSKKLSWEDAITYCENLSLAWYDDWRLPNINELNSVVDDTKQRPALSAIFVQNSGTTWSSTTHQSFRREAKMIIFGGYGTVGYINKSLRRGVRCVRTVDAAQ